MKLTAEQIKLAREWISQCQWQDWFDEEDNYIDQSQTITDNQVISCVEREFGGGLKTFIETCEA